MSAECRVNDHSVALVVSQGLRDLLYFPYGESIAPNLSPESTYALPERVLADEQIDLPLDSEGVQLQLREAVELGCKKLIVVLMHSLRYPQHEQAVASFAEKFGFEQIILSHQCKDASTLLERLRVSCSSLIAGADHKNPISTHNVNPSFILQASVSQAELVDLMGTDPELLERTWPLMIHKLNKAREWEYQIRCLHTMVVTTPEEDVLRYRLLRSSGRLEALCAGTRFEFLPGDILCIYRPFEPTL